MELCERDLAMMCRALELARVRLGLTGSNPSVGCVITGFGGEVIAEAATGVGGRPHAEEQALSYAGEGAYGSQMYVTLEPCSRRSIAAFSCAHRIVVSGLRRVLIGCLESNERASGGAGLLREAGIEVVSGVCELEALSLLADLK